MSISLEYLWKNKWFNAVVYKNYHFFHQPKPTIAVLPIDCNTRKVLLRREYLPCYEVNDPTPQDLHWTVVSGAWEEGDLDPEATMLRELKEETGIVPAEHNEYNVSVSMQVSKCTDMRVKFFLLYLYNYTMDEQAKETPTNEFDAKAVNVWMTVPEVVSIREDLDLLGRYLWMWYKSGQK